MADRIKGITIELNGDTTGLSKALKNVNSQIKSTQSQLNDVKKLLKLDPGNTELLSQKQKLLSQAVEETKQKLSQLKEAEKQVQQQFSQGKVSEKQYDALKREIADTEISLKSLEKQAAGANVALQKLGKAGESIQKAGNKITSVGKGMSKVSAGIASIGGASVAAWSELDAAYDYIAQGTGAVGDNLKDLQESFDRVFTSLPTDAETAGTAIADLNTRFGFTGSVLEEASKSFIQFADVNNTDVSSAVQNVSRYMGDAGIDASHYKEVLDALTAASQASGLSVDKLSEMLTKYGAPMRALGLTTQESIAIFAGWEKAGVNTEIAFSGMKKAIGTWGKNGKDARVEFKKTLDEIAAAPDIAAATTKAIEVFGQKAGPDLADAIKGGRFEYEDFLNVVNASSGQLEATWQETQDPIDRFKTAMNGVKKSASDLGGTILEVLSPMLEQLAGKIQEVGNWFSGLSEEQQQMIVKIGLIVGAIGPILIILGTVISSVGKIVSMIKMVQTAFSALSAVMLANPIGVIIAAITALVAAFTYLWNTNDEFRQFWIDLWANIKEVAVQVWNDIKEAFSEAWEAISTTAQNVWNDIGDFLSSVWEGIKSKVTSAVNGIKDTISTVWNSITNTIYTVLNTIMTTVGDAFSNIWNGIKGTMEKITSTIEEGFNVAIEFITSLPEKALKWGKDIIDNLVQGISAGIDAVGKAVEQVADKIWAFLHFSEPDEGPLSNFHTFMPDMIDMLTDGMKEGIPDVKKVSNELAEAIAPEADIGQGLKLAEGIVDSVRANKENAEKNAEELADAVLKAAQERLDDYKVYNDLMLKEEVDFWDAVRKQTQDGTKARIDADKKYFDAKKSLNEKMEAAETQYTENVAKAYENLNEKIKDLNKEYSDEVDSRTDEIKNAFGLFDEFSSETDLTSNDLLTNLQSQVDGLRQWGKNLEELAERGVGEDLIKELQDMGPQSAAQVKLLTQMTDDQLDRYVSMFRTKNRLARKQAVSELQPMQQDIAKQIAQLKTETSRELAEYQQEYISAMSELGLAISQPAEDMKLAMAQNAIELVSTLAETVKTESSSADNTERFKTLADNILKASDTLPQDMQKTGQNVVSGMIAGIQSKEAELYALVSNIARKVSATLQSALSFSGVSDMIPAGMNATINSGMVRDRSAVSSRYSLGDVLSLLEAYLPEIASQKEILLNGDAVVGRTVTAMDRKLGSIQELKGRING